MSGYADIGILPQGGSEKGNSFFPKLFSVEGLIEKPQRVLKEG